LASVPSYIQYQYYIPEKRKREDAGRAKRLERIARGGPARPPPPPPPPRGVHAGDDEEDWEGLGQLQTSIRSLAARLAPHVVAAQARVHVARDEHDDDDEEEEATREEEQQRRRLRAFSGGGLHHDQQHQSTTTRRERLGEWGPEPPPLPSTRSPRLGSMGTGRARHNRRPTASHGAHGAPPTAMRAAYNQPSAQGMEKNARSNGDDGAVVPSAQVDVPLVVEVLEVGGVPVSVMRTGGGDGKNTGPVGASSWGTSSAGGSSNVSTAINWAATRAMMSCVPGGGGGGINWAIEADERRERRASSKASVASSPCLDPSQLSHASYHPRADDPNINGYPHHLDCGDHGNSDGGGGSEGCHYIPGGGGGVELSVSASITHTGARVHQHSTRDSIFTSAGAAGGVGVRGSGGGDAQLSGAAAARIDPAAPSTLAARWGSQSGQQGSTDPDRAHVVLQPAVKDLPRAARLTLELLATSTSQRSSGDDVGSRRAGADDNEHFFPNLLNCAGVGSGAGGGGGGESDMSVVVGRGHFQLVDVKGRLRLGTHCLHLTPVPTTNNASNEHVDDSTSSCCECHPPRVASAAIADAMIAESSSTRSSTSAEHAHHRRRVDTFTGYDEHGFLIDDDDHQGGVEHEHEHPRWSCHDGGCICLVVSITVPGWYRAAGAAGAYADGRGRAGSRTPVVGLYTLNPVDP
jgi:hypothetical protein